MRLKIYFQAILILIIGSIIGFFYYSFFHIKEDKISKIEDDQTKKKIYENNEISNEMTNIEYNSEDGKGNTFYINAKKAVINLNDKKKNLVKMEGVTSIIFLKDKGQIIVYSNNAVYNKSNHDTSFYDSVEMVYMDNSILAENLDLKFSENKSTIYNNVVFKNNNLSLYTDKIFFDMVSGNIKFQMMDNTKKVKLITKNEFVN